ncbi:MAG: glutathione peroxidase [Oleiphilaceae bacterium]|nr:glutathione peroxidase [Oleiphilaceae bacterium]
MNLRSLISCIMLMMAGSAFSAAARADCPDWLDQDVNRLRSVESVNLCQQFGDKLLLVVNTASFCGFTGQFEGLEALYQAYRKEGFEILGVPSNDFRQAAATEEKTAEVCFVDYKVTFTMIAPQRVRGDDAHPLFRTLTEMSGQQPTWNFNKYLVDQVSGRVWHFPSHVKPGDPAIRERIEALL